MIEPVGRDALGLACALCRVVHNNGSVFKFSDAGHVEPSARNLAIARATTELIEEKTKE